MSLHLATAFIAKWRPGLTNAALFAFITLFLCLFVHCEEECLRSKVECYECESTKDPNCNDPFNATAIDGSMITCEGCCVKVVRDRNTPKKSIWRTCTSKLQINLFMVDHVCMEESGGIGEMCFCEADACNSGPPQATFSRSLQITAILTSTLFLVKWPLWPSFLLTHRNAYRLALALLLLASIFSFCAFLHT